MADLFPRDFKIICFEEEEDLPKLKLNNEIGYCSTINEFRKVLLKNRSSILIIACKNDAFHGIAHLLNNLTIDTIYILTDQADIMWPVDFFENYKVIKVGNQNEMMRHLCTKAMLCYFNQGLEYQKNDNMGLANKCFNDALNALNQAKQFR